MDDFRTAILEMLSFSKRRLIASWKKFRIKNPGGEKVYVILDNARYNRSYEVEDFRTAILEINPNVLIF